MAGAAHGGGGGGGGGAIMQPPADDAWDVPFETWIKGVKAEALKTVVAVSDSYALSVYIRVAQRLEEVAVATAARGNDVDTYAAYVRLAAFLVQSVPRHAGFTSPLNRDSAGLVRAMADRAVAAAGEARSRVQVAFEAHMKQLRGQVAAARARKAAATASAAAAAAAAVAAVTAPARPEGPLPLAPAYLECATPGVPATLPVAIPLDGDVEPELAAGGSGGGRSSASGGTGAISSALHPAVASLRSGGGAGGSGPLLRASSLTGPISPLPMPPPGTSPATSMYGILSASLSDWRGGMPGSLGALAPTLPSDGGTPGWVSRGGLRRVLLPNSLITEFTDIAAPNTNFGPRGIETCGILAAVEAGDDLLITDLLIPEQRGDADRCEMLNEDALLMACLDRSVIVVGWIHTHPSQSCFLSSMDQHTHCGYQLSLAEAVAVVVSPKDATQKYAVFRLTDEPGASGLSLVQRCTQRAFHPHDAAYKVFDDCGHTVFVDRPLRVTDLRGAPRS